MLDKEKLAALCQDIVTAFANETSPEAIAKQQAFMISDKPRIVEMCDDVMHAFTCKIDNGFFATIMRPQLNVSTRKELTVVAINSLAYYVHRHFSNYPAIVAATGKLNDFWIEYQQELERTGDYD
jgi:hypothetical protein